MNFPAKKILPRYIVIFFLFTVAGVAIIARAAYLIFGDKEYWMAVSARFKKENQEVPATRGNILAAGGEVLATSLPEYKIFMDFMTWEKDPKRKARAQFVRDSLLEDKMDSICNGMHAIFPDIDPAKLRAHLLKGRKKKSHHWPIYHKRITYLQYKQVKALPLFKMSANSGGFHCDEIKLRKNPYGELARRTVGLFTYKGEDEVLTGLELAFDSVLRGKPGSAHRQKVLSRYLTIVDQPAEDGLDIQTTIDVNFQDICEKALNDKLVEINANQGLCILMEVQTGDVKAITSMRRVGDGVYKEMDVDAMKNLLEPGSVFKPVSFLVAMNDGYIDMDDWVDTGCGIRPMYGRNMKDHNHRSGGYGVLTVPQILQKSSNIGVSVLIDKFYHNQPEKFVDGVYRTGIAEDLHLPIPGYAKPRIRRPLPDGSNWSKTALPWMSIGYETQIPPISTLNFYNGIANNGKMLQPRFVKAILKNGEVVKEFPVKVIREQMEQMIVSGQAKNHAVIYTDFDRFNLINQKYGFAFGDKLLQIFTSFVSDALSNKKNILFSRIVADQFILFRPYENIADAEARVDAINNHFMDYVTKQYPFLKLRLRSGIYHVTTECKTAAEAIDAANYARKSLLNNHQTTAALYNEALANKQQLERLIFANANTAFTEKNFKVFLQPKFSLVDNSLIGAEALIRWFKDDGTVHCKQDANGEVVNLSFKVEDFQEKAKPEDTVVYFN